MMEEEIKARLDKGEGVPVFLILEASGHKLSLTAYSDNVDGLLEAGFAFDVPDVQIAAELEVEQAVKPKKPESN